MNLREQLEQMTKEELIDEFVRLMGTEHRPLYISLPEKKVHLLTEAFRALAKFERSYDKLKGVEYR